MRVPIKVVACAIVLAGCREKKQEESAGDVARALATAAMPVTQAAWAPDALDELVAPIALYPDQLVGQILAASVNTQEVLDAGNWLLQNQSLKGEQLDAAAQKAGFGPATRALVQFPTVVDMLCQEIDWTKQLGAAFTSDQRGVLDAIQRLRAQAAEVGNLESTPQQIVEHKKEDGKEFVEVKPADPKVVYVPQYDPTIIYTTPAPAPAPAPAPPPQENTVSTGAAVAGGLLAFGVGVLVGSAMNDNCYPSWGHGAVYYGPRPFYPPAYVYRPVYGPAFRPAYGYAPPAGYRNRYNSPTNIVINNNNYYNRFSNQNNIRVNQPRNAAVATRQAGAGNRAGSPANPGRGQDWKARTSGRRPPPRGRLTRRTGRPPPPIGGPRRRRGPAEPRRHPRAARRSLTRTPPPTHATGVTAPRRPREVATRRADPAPRTARRRRLTWRAISRTGVRRATMPSRGRAGRAPARSIGPRVPAGTRAPPRRGSARHAPDASRRRRHASSFP